MLVLLGFFCCFKNTVIQDKICAIFKVYIHSSVEKRKDVFLLEEQIHLQHVKVD